MVRKVQNENTNFWTSHTPFLKNYRESVLAPELFIIRVLNSTKYRKPLSWTQDVLLLLYYTIPFCTMESERCLFVWLLNSDQQNSQENTTFPLFVLSYVNTPI